MKSLVAFLPGPALCLCLLAGGRSQAPAPMDAPKPDATKPLPVTVNYLDGSTVHMALAQETVEIETAFGKLTVPRSHLRSIEFGFRLGEAEARQIEELVAQLGNASYKQRELALNQLIALGAKAYPTLQRAAQSKDGEVLGRARKAREAIEKKVPARVLKRRPEDVVRTDKFTIVGRVLTPALLAHTEYFGEVRLKPSQLFSMSVAGNAGEVEVVVDAGTHGSAVGQWLDTNMHVSAQERLTFVASGQVDLWPQGPGQYMATPDGQTGTIFRPYAQSFGPQVAVAGALLGRIGENGRPFLVGRRLTRTFDQEGKLYLHIVPSPWNNASTGSYRVRISGASVQDRDAD